MCGLLPVSEIFIVDKAGHLGEAHRLCLRGSWALHRGRSFELGCGLCLSRASLMCGLMPRHSEIFIDRQSGAPWRGRQALPARFSSLARPSTSIPSFSARMLCFSFSLHSLYFRPGSFFGKSRMSVVQSSEMERNAAFG